MIKLQSFKPEFFNNNGDQGNIEVLARQLSWRGVPSLVSSTVDPEADFLLLGDGSRAVIREFELELLELIPALGERLAAGKPTLLVGSAYEFFAGKVTGLPALEFGERKSEFRLVSSGGLEAFGYRNTESLTDLFISGAFIATELYGPVLAKSPELLALVLDSLGVSTALPLELAARLEGLVEGVRSSNAG